jgi:hypothetical protein
VLLFRADHLAGVFLDHDRGARGLFQQLVIQRERVALVLHGFAQDVTDVVLVRLEERADRDRGMLAELRDQLARRLRVGERLGRLFISVSSARSPRVRTRGSC